MKESPIDVEMKLMYRAVPQLSAAWTPRLRSRRQNSKALRAINAPSGPICDPVCTPKPPANQSPRLRQAMRQRFRRRCAMEPTIAHFKSDFRLARNYLRGFAGDSLNLLLAAAA